MKAPRTTKGDAEPRSTKPVRPPDRSAINPTHAHGGLAHRTMGALIDSAASGRGRRLDAGVQQTMESAFDADLSGVRVHTPDAAPRGVEAAASGSHLLFGHGRYQPHSERGRRLIAHELAHVVQQSRTSQRSDGDAHLEQQAERAAERASAGTKADVSGGSTPPIQFRIKPEDVASEMVGQTFELIAAHTSGAVALATGDQVRVEKWDADAMHSVAVLVITGKATGQRLVVPQRVLAPARASVPGVAPYSAGVASQAKAVKKAEDRLAAFESTKPNYKTPKAKKMFAAEDLRQRQLLETRRGELNRREIQQQMFNRFDAVIAREVAAANASHGLTGRDALDPNLVKSQIFQESEMGTSGQWISDPPSDQLHTRFNVNQVIDSGGLALLTLMEREYPALITKYKLKRIRKDLDAAQTEKHTLEKKAHRTAADNARLEVLRNKAGLNWDIFVRQYVATGETVGFQDAVNELFASSTPPRHVDYAFWIHLAVLWLFEKKKSGMSWPNAIKAYNGTGVAAEHYKQAVVGRAAAAVSAQATGADVIPSH